VDAWRHHDVLMALLLALMLGMVLLPCSEGRAATAKAATFVGSLKCKECHDKIYATWRQTIHAKAIQNVTENPQAIQGTGPNPLNYERSQKRM
jgi:Cytochrome c554 and c-prime